MTWVSPRTWLAGEKLTAAKLQELSDSLKAIGDPWASYTPTLTASVSNPAPSAYSGGYIQAGKLVMFRFKITMSATVGSGTYSIALPVAGNALFPAAFGRADLFDSSAGVIYPRTLLSSGGSTLGVLNDENATRVAATVPFTFATGDIIAGYGMYEAA
jgi:hypothetical protein